MMSAAKQRTSPADPRTTIRPTSDAGLTAASPALVWCIAALSLLPFLLNLPRFRELYYFGDEWDLLSQIADVGLIRWSVLPFAENTVPLFKFLWGGAIFLFNGSYMWLLVLVWLTHLAIIATFGSILRRLEFSAFVVVSSMLTCGLAWSNIESLAWSVQWSPMLATLFFMLAWRILIDVLRANAMNHRVAAKLGLYGAFLLASAMCFSRGVISGFVLGCYVAFGTGAATMPVVRRALLAISSIVPIALVALVYLPGMMLAPTQRYSVQANFDAMLAFGAHCFLLNPLFQIASWDPVRVTLWAVVVFGLFKAAVIVSGFSATQKSRDQILLLGTLVLFDFLNCCLLSVGRYDTGIQASVSSRYQYISLLCLAPFLGAIMQRAVLTARAGRVEKAGAACLLLAWCALLTYRWPDEMKIWAVWRGTAVRSALKAQSTPQERFANALLDSGRAAQLQTKYNLH